MASELERRVRGVAALDQPLRRTLHHLVAERAGWVTRDEAAAAAGVPRSVAAFHLDKLAEAGVLEVSYERPEGRTGPGAGRPAKRYRVHDEEVAASVPDRRYDLAGSLLVTAVAEAERTGEPVGACLSAAARTAGEAIGAESQQALDGAEADEDRQQAVVAVLARHGYEPDVVDGEIVLVNCPFHRLAEEQRNLVCGMNLDFLDGLLAGIGSADGLDARLAPEPGFCCVRIAAA